MSVRLPRGRGWPLAFWFARRADVFRDVAPALSHSLDLDATMIALEQMQDL